MSAHEAVTIRGTVELMYYASPSFSAGRLRVDAQEVVTFAGEVMLQKNDLVVLHGGWHHHPKFGRQLKVTHFEFDQAPSATGLAHYLANHPDLKGIGPVKALRIAKAFGTAFGEAIEHEPERVRAVGQLTATAVELLRDTWLRNRDVNASFEWMASFELTHHQMTKLIKRFGNSVVSILKSDPYLLIREVPGFGFKRVDVVARKLGIAKDHHGRLRAGLVHCVAERLSRGDCWVGYETLVGHANDLLVMDVKNSRDVIAKALDEALAEGVLACVSISGRFLVAQQAVLDQEQGIAAMLVAHCGANPHFGAAVAGPPLDERLNPAQRRAVMLALTYNVVVISGPGGAGKTFVIGELAKVYAARGLRIVLAAPTGKAAKRMEEVVARSAVTLHRLLGYNGKTFTLGRSDPVDADLLVIDEVSMIDVALAWHLLQAVDLRRTTLVLVGDHNQLPPVGPGNVLRDLLDRGLVPSVVLEQVMRQAGALKTSSLAILRGEIMGTAAGLPGKPSPWVVANRFAEAADAQAYLRELYERVLAERLGFALATEVQLLTPTRKGVLGSDELNAMIQRVVQHRSYGIDIVQPPTGRRAPLYVHDRVIQLRNNYDLGVMNGAIGFVTEIGSAPGEVAVRFDDHDVFYSSDTVGELALAYALTIHKFQGSQIPCAVVVIHRSHAFMHHRNLFYTGVTRAQQTAIIVGDAVGMRMCAAKEQVERRKTFLSVIDLPRHAASAR